MTTTATPDDIRAAAGRHDNSASQFDGTEKGVASAVDTFVSQNDGDLVFRFNDLQDSWSGNVKKLIGNVNAMAAELRKAADLLEEQNRKNAGRI